MEFGHQLSPLPKHAVNTSLYALFRHPWLHKVLEGAITAGPRAPEQDSDLLHQRRIRQFQVDAFDAGFNGQKLQVLANLGFDVFVR